LTDLPSLQSHPFSWPKPVPAIHWGEALAGVAADPGVPAVSWCRPGEDAAREALRFFIQQRLPRYHLDRNDPNLAVQSDLSPYLHFGQIGAQRVAREVQQAEAPSEAKKAFLEELIVRRELSDNFCFYNPDYDKFSGFPEWARRR
jgi:deoxyribodipyrimidine photo-lyase